MSIPYPITVKSITGDPSIPILRPKLLFGGQCGDFVSVRPCDIPKDASRTTFLGVLIGDLAQTFMLSWAPQEGVLTVTPGMYNPMIYVPELKRVVMGCESWWGQIESDKHLREITDDDIGNVWYVQALKALAEKDAAEGQPS